LGETTSLYDATKKGIEWTERMLAFRDAVTEGGVVGTGTLVVVTDGEETANGSLDTTLIANTHVNVISVGVGSSVIDEKLGAIGRDGSFLAPTSEDRIKAFTEIAERVRQYPERVYMLGYCSPATQGQLNVRVSLYDPEPVLTAGCQVNADLFDQAPDACSLDLFEVANGCSGLACGGMLACGGCPDGQCCSGGQCHEPGPTAGDCAGQDELCDRQSQYCEVRNDPAGAADACQPLRAIGAECTRSAECGPGVGECKVVDGVKRCVPSGMLQAGDYCGTKTDHDPYRCSTLNCQSTNRSRENPPFECAAQPRAFDSCEDGGICESGTYCDGTRCIPRGVWGCDRGEQCASGVCIDHKCQSTGQCHYGWSEKVSQ
jgi:hypothetical protein